ncbi:MAG: dihydroneopterin aldolase [Candidatus Methylacidiphilales bacterium]
MTSGTSITLLRQRVPCYIGVPEEERSEKQILEISTTYRLPPQDNTSDDLSRTVDYSKVAQRVVEVSGERPRQLVETLAEDLVAMLFKEFNALQVEIEIRKFILPDMEAVVLRHLAIRPEQR